MMNLCATELTRAFSLSSSLFLAVPFSEELLYFSIFSSSIFKNDIMLFIWYLVTWLCLSGMIKLKLKYQQITRHQFSTNMFLELEVLIP